MKDVIASGESQIRSAIEDWYWAGIAAVDPYAATVKAISRAGDSFSILGQPVALPASGKIVGIAVGKAAAAMARGLADVLGDRLAEGIVLTKDGHLRGAPKGWELFEAAHPVPDHRGVAATRRIIDAVDHLGANDLVIVLVSGGGSALLESPQEPLELADIQLVTELLLRAGAPIQDLNAVRRELSDVKGGGLRRHIGDATCVSLILSDVLGNDPTMIASGPTVPRRSDPSRAADLIQRYGIGGIVSPAVNQLLTSASPGEAPRSVESDVFGIVGDNASFVGAVAAAAEQDGLHTCVAMVAAEGEARILADGFLNSVVHQPDEVDVVIGGGEATVTVLGNGVGGRNTEFALAAAIRLNEASIPWVVGSLASDGQDGSIEAAGAIVDEATIARGQARGLSSRNCLDDNDSGTYLRETRDLLVTGPTGTNVNDVYIAVRKRATS